MIETNKEKSFKTLPSRLEGYATYGHHIEPPYSIEGHVPIGIVVGEPGREIKQIFEGDYVPPCKSIKTTVSEKINRKVIFNFFRTYNTNLIVFIF